MCVDENSKQLRRQTRAPIPGQPGQCVHEDYEYRRAGTRNLFVAVEPKGKRRCVEVTARRTKVDLVAFVKNLLETVYATALTVPFVLDNLNPHFRHASWLNMAEIEIGIRDRQGTGQRIGTAELLQAEIAPWQQQRNAAGRGLEWKFTRQDADRKLWRHYGA